MRHHPRLDNTHHEVVAALRKVGALVLSLASLGGGAPDLLVCFRGRLWLMEVKTPGEKLRAGQLAFKASWPVLVVESGQQAIDALARL